MEEKWELLDLTGPVSAFAVHAATDTLVYAVGTVVILWDVHSDKRVNLRCHEFKITSVVFSPDQEFLLTAETSLQPMVCVWRWRSMEQLGAKWLPFKSRLQPPAKVISQFAGNRCFLLECEDQGGYRLSIWDWRAPELVLQQVAELEVQVTCVDLHLLTDNVTFLTSEEQCLKIWKLENPVVINKRMHLKSEVVASAYYPNSSLFFLLLNAGSVMVVNRTGKGVATVSHPRLRFSAIAIFQDYLYVGGEQGSLAIYAIASFRLFKEVPPSHTARIDKIHVNGGNLVYLFFSDATVQVVNISQAAIINQTSGHGCQVNCSKWLPKWNFVTSSDEGCLYIWNYAGKGWTMQALDVSGGIEKLKVTAIGVHPGRPIVCCGFSNGAIKFLELSGTPKIIGSFEVSIMQVSCVKYTPSGLFFAVCYNSGLCVLFDNEQRPVYHLEETAMHQSVFYTAVDFYEERVTYKSRGSREVVGGQAIKAVTAHDASTVQLHDLVVQEGQLSPGIAKNFHVDGAVTGFALHPSGDYVIVTSDVRAIYVFHAETTEIRGVIELDGKPKGCYIDPSGLYVAVLLPNKSGLFTRLHVYESGTGRRTAELSRFEPVTCSESVSFSSDGRFIIIGCGSGFLSVWKVPSPLTENMLEVLEQVQQKPDFWKQFPIYLPKKEVSLPLKPDLHTLDYLPPRQEDLEVEEGSGQRNEQGGFAESIVSFVKPKRPETQAAKTKGLYEPQPGTDAPVALTRDYWQRKTAARPKASNQDPNLYRESRETRMPIPSGAIQLIRPANTAKPASAAQIRDRNFTQAQPLQVKKSTIRYPEPEEVDVTCDEPAYNPAQRLYEGISERSESVYDEAERAYQDMERFP